MSRKSRYHEEYEYDDYEDEKRGGKKPFRMKERKYDKNKDREQYENDWWDDQDDRR